jgi:hypothetical protein
MGLKASDRVSKGFYGASAGLEPIEVSAERPLDRRANLLAHNSTPRAAYVSSMEKCAYVGPSIEIQRPQLRVRCSGVDCYRSRDHHRPFGSSGPAPVLLARGLDGRNRILGAAAAIIWNRIFSFYLARCRRCQMSSS